MRYLESVAEVDDEGGVIGSDADPLAVLQHLQPTHLILQFITIDTLPFIYSYSSQLSEWQSGQKSHDITEFEGDVI